MRDVDGLCWPAAGERAGGGARTDTDRHADVDGSVNSLLAARAVVSDRIAGESAGQRSQRTSRQTMAAEADRCNRDGQHFSAVDRFQLTTVADMQRGGVRADEGSF